MPISSDVPARIDRLPWSRFHTRLVIALGACWVLDGLEAVIISNVGVQLAEPENLGIGPTQIGSLGSVYLLAEVVGALLFGHLADRFGRRRLFFVTLTVYFLGSLSTALVVGGGVVAFGCLLLTRFVAGIGIGGEYAAVNSMVDELVPAPYRGRVDIAINGVYWAGAAVAAGIQVPLLAGAIDPTLDWRLAVVVGPVLAIVVFFLRRRIPESPRWQLFHGRSADAEEGARRIEDEVASTAGPVDPVEPRHTIQLRPYGATGYLTLLRELFVRHRTRALLGATLMVTQSVLYNAVFFNYPSVLVTYYRVDADDTAFYFVPFALANLLGPLALGHLFDTIGRRRMISRTYRTAGVLLLASGVVFALGLFSAATHTLAWCVAFFFCSAGASSAYLTVSEIFPMEVRAKAVAAFFAVSQFLGAGAPVGYGALIDQRSPSPDSLFVAFVLGAALMLLGSFVAKHLAVDAEKRPLEQVAGALSLVHAPRHQPAPDPERHP